jgi:hypothetical protein
MDEHRAGYKLPLLSSCPCSSSALTWTPVSPTWAIPSGPRARLTAMEEDE